MRYDIWDTVAQCDGAHLVMLHEGLSQLPYETIARVSKL